LKQLQTNPGPDEKAARSVNISIDDVGVKRQQETRDKGPVDLPQEEKPSKSDTKYGHNTLVHLQKEDSQYVFNGQGAATTLRMVIAFLFSNKWLDNNLLFVVDGQKTLHAAVIKRFAVFRNIQLIVDWSHLEKKGKEQLSLALRGRLVRNQVLEKLMALLWNGCVDAAVSYVNSVKPSWIKDQNLLAQLIDYLERHKPFIPWYCVRKKLGLRNSSNVGEKQNDLIVAERQKHHGMSWSKSGSLALASLTALVSNNEADGWFSNQRISFKLAA